MAFNFKKFFEGIRIVGKTTPTSDTLGDLEVLTSDHKLHFHNGTISDPVVTEADTATLTNKTIDASQNTITGVTATIADNSVTVIKLNSGAATIGQVLTADGSGSQSYISPTGITFTDWAAYTVNITGLGGIVKGTTSVDNGQWRRVGDSMEIMYQYVQTAGGSSGSPSIYNFSLPLGLTIDTGKLPTGDYNLGSCTVSTNSDGIDSPTYLGMVVAQNSSHLNLYVQSSAGVLQYVGSGGFAPLGTTSVLYSFRVTIPISGWS